MRRYLVAIVLAAWCACSALLGSAWTAGWTALLVLAAVAQAAEHSNDYHRHRRRR